ncbi:dimethylaniline monooxygenase [N-oxide-forming] 5-like [Sigmodon hispidus]
MTIKKIAVIGAGVSGLGAIKSCLEEGLEPTCFEKSSDIGGLWRYEETTESGKAGIYKSLTCNTSKEMTAFSDYPIPDHYPNYLHNSKMMEYLRMYARHFGLMKYIQFQTKVCSIRKRPDFSSSGQWDVVVEVDEVQKTYVFDGVMVCSGHYTEKHFPLQDFPGITKFQGKYLHSWEYKHPDNFMGNIVVVIGIGNSRADVAVYTFSFPFLDDHFEILDSEHTVFKFVSPPQLEKPTLAFIGILKSVGATIPTSELQDQWVVHVFTDVMAFKGETAPDHTLR